MSIIEKENNKNGNKELLIKEKNKENQNNLKDQNLEEFTKESKLSAKELIKQLLKNKLNISLMKLEKNNLEHISSINTISKSFENFSKYIDNLTKQVDEFKKQKLKKAQIAKKGKKISRSNTSESNLIKFKRKTALGIVDNIKKNNNNIKRNINANLNKKLGNRTLTNFRLIGEIKEENTNQKTKFQNYAYGTAQNFRKINHKQEFVTPREMGKVKVREKKLERSMSQNTKLSLESFTKKANFIKKIGEFHERTKYSNFSNTLPNIDEKIEQNSLNNNKKINKNQQFKSIIYKKDKKLAFENLNNQLDKENEKKNKDIKNLETNEKQVKDIDKIVNNVNLLVNNLDKNFYKNQNIKKIINDVNQNNKIERKPYYSSKVLIKNAIKETIIQDIETNKENQNLVNHNDNDNNNENKILNEIKKKENNDSINYYLKNNNNTNLKDNLIKNDKKEKILSHFRLYFNNEDIKNVKLKKNKSPCSIRFVHNIFINNNYEIRYNRSYKKFTKGIIENKSIKDKNKIVNILYKSQNNINNSETINKLGNKIEDNIDIINSQKKEIKEKEQLNENSNSQIKIEDNKIDNHQNIEFNNKQPSEKKENIDEKQSNLIINKSEKMLTKLKTNFYNFIKRRTSFDNNSK